MHYTIIQKGKSAVRIYEDSRPHHYKSMDIQKGLILVYDGEEISGEGIGFGAPVVKYADKTYFSKDATLSVPKKSDFTSVSKVFEINGVLRRRLLGRRIDSPLFYSAGELFSRIHRECKRLRKPVTALSACFRKYLQQQIDLIRTHSKGRIAISYQIYADSILVRVDASQLDKTDCKEICIMNEQGAGFFRKYTDTDGFVFTDNQIGAWEKVEAKEAYFSDLKEQVRFGLFNIADATLYSGREEVAGYLAWAGFAYSVPPGRDKFEYSIRVQGG